MDNQIFKNQYALNKMIVWLKNALEFNPRQFNRLEKDDTRKQISVSHPKKGNCANLAPGEIYLEIETSEKNHNQEIPWIFGSITPVRIKNEIAHSVD